ncbi:hypothetical protein PMZ80_002910 [Knufia obscura]|uniref:Uncharacterized protein n=2 Tax=Knufia TaxID=430999 RepID=A0AAN8ESB2_9EURO|nr:hypothetical protein PMZ80_002910 [Knufia obscura]KAK5952501.1 hypothetical protein OHC33_006545 [Knufia fluminis]
MASWLKRTQSGTQSAQTTGVPGLAPLPNPTNAGRFRDPNAPDVRLECESKCIYERRLPGNAYITAHVTRLQDGFYDSPSTHGDAIDNVRFLAVSFVFHPSETINRFQAATVSIELHDDTDQSYTDPGATSHRLSAHGVPVPKQKPKFLRFAPHVMFGGVSPETLDWNFNLTGSLGVSQAPVSASLSPSGGVKGGYKVYQMMRIQGSTRTVRSHPFDGPSYDVEDGEVVWTMEENQLQRSGLPREMTFVALITKGDVENVVFDINIEPRIASRFGHYPKFWTNQMKYQPLQKEHMDLDRELGQRFLPTVPGRGFNFANLAGTFNDFVKLPGTVYSLTDQAFTNQVAVNDAIHPQQQTGAPSKARKSLSRRSTTQAQNAQLQPPGRPQSVPPQQPASQSTMSAEEPMDYHIYLHNPRSINLHATPPPPSNSAPPALPSITSISNPFQATDPVPRPRTTAPIERSNSPANTKLKRRSMTIGHRDSMLSPVHSQTALRNPSTSSRGSHGSLRRSRSRTDLRNSPLVEDSNSSDTSSSRVSNTSAARREIIPPSEPSPLPHPIIPSPPQSPEDAIIPMTAPSPPSSANMLSPPLPSWRAGTSGEKSLIGSGGGSGSAGAGATGRQTLPFELNRPTRPSSSRNDSSNSSRSDRTRRPPRARDSPSPLRTRREITPSPDGSDNDDFVDMSGGTNSETTPEDDSKASGSIARGTTRTEREISPYAAMVNGIKAEEIDEAKGDLKALRARKRFSMPAHHHYSYITGADADKDWEER